MYNSMAIVIKEPSWLFMNYGYEWLDSSSPEPQLDNDDEKYRYSIQLYHHLALNIDFKNKSVLEVGCGRGGGSVYISRYFQPLHVTGLDFSKKAIAFCRNNYNIGNLDFVEGDAENLPFPDNSYDVIINVESSHCYSSMEAFLEQVSRVLKPGGFFLLTDFREDSHVDIFRNNLSKSGLTVVSSFDITRNVHKALDNHTENRNKMISDAVPKPFVKLFKEFAGSKGTSLYQRFADDRIKYLSFVMQKIP